MRPLLLILSMLMLITLSVRGQAYKVEKPVSIKGQLYDLALYIPSSQDSNGNRLVAISFYLLTQDPKNAFSNDGGNFRYIRNVYEVDSNYENKKVTNIVRDKSSEATGVFINYTRCYLKMSGDHIKLQLSNGMESEKIKMTFLKVESDLFLVQMEDIMPLNSSNPEIPPLQDTCTKDSECLDDFNVQPYSIRIAGDIDSPEFPDNLYLRKIVNENHDFIFRLSMDLYLDMMRFKAINYEYDKRNIMNFLWLHDLFYLRYEKNEPVLNRKINACVKLLREASRNFNGGDIFYKDYDLEFTAEDVQRKPFLLLKPDPYRDDYYTTKRIKGEPDEYYSKNGLNVYLTNWKVLSDPGVRTFTDAFLSGLATTNEVLTLRIYFVIQPVPAYSSEGDFKGVTAYGLKGIVFKGCPSNMIASIDNKSVRTIEDPSTKKLYSDAVSYLNKAVKESELAGKLDASGLYRNNYLKLGEWHQVLDDCEEGFTYLAGRGSRLNNKEALITFRLMTNYNCTIQPGYEITFSNRFSEVHFSFPISNATVGQSMCAEGYYTLSIKVSEKDVIKMKEAKVNSISCQCQGVPRYKVPKRYILPYPGAVININTERISTPLPADIKGHSDLMNNLLDQAWK